MTDVKVVITGPVGSGKTAFVRSVSQTPAIETDEISTIGIGKGTTTVALDFGTVVIEETLIRLFGTPGQERFSFMWEDLMVGATGIVFLVDSSDPDSLPEAKRMLRSISEYGIPFVVGATRQDLRGAMPPKDIASHLGLPEWMVKGVVATDGESVRELLTYFLGLLKQKGGKRWVD